MKYIWFGIKDYIKDKRHDHYVYKLFCIYRRPMYFTPAEDDEMLLPIREWREGSVWHYIRQRKEYFADASKKIKKRK